MYWYEENNNNNIIISSRIRLARNLKNYPFYDYLSKEKSKEIINLVNNSIFNKNNYNNFFDKVDFDNLSKIKQYTMLEKYIISDTFLESKKPKGLILEKNGNINIMINEEDHIRIQAINNGYNIEKCFEEANRIDNLLEENLSFAFNNQYGYLTSCITNLGTGLRASFMVHIPMLYKYGYIPSIVESITKFGMTIRGMHGEGTKSFGGIYQISNQVTLGKTENQIIEDLKGITFQIIEREKALREGLKENINSDTIDKIYRSYGTLKYCKKIKFEEAMICLSNIWLGIYCNILEKPINNSIYKIMMSIQPANIIDKFDIDDKNNIELYRAKYLNSVL